MALTEHDGSFRRLMEMVKERQSVSPGGKPGRPSKNRVATTGHFSVNLHDQMKSLARIKTEHAGCLISTSDMYNEAAAQLLTDLHELLGENLRLPAGAMSLSGILGLRELVARPVYTPLRNLGLRSGKLQRTTVYIERPIWDALMEMSLRFGLSLRRTIYVPRLLELASAWYLAGLKTQNR